MVFATNSVARKLLPGLVLGALLAVASACAKAAGFAVDFEGARALGTATAGSASAVDATTIFYNPAGMLYLERNEFIAGGQLFLLHDRFTNAGSTILGGAIATPGGNGSDAIPATVIPWFFVTRRIMPDLSVGLGVFAPFGLRTDYGSDFVGRYQNEVTALTVIDLNPAIAYRPLPWLSIGGGATVEYAHLRLTQAIDFGSACLVALGAGPCASAFGLRPGLSDGQAELLGNDVALGFSLGALAEPIPGTRLSVAYRSKIDHHFGSAKQSFDVPAGARAFLAAGGAPSALTGGYASTDLPLPARVSFGLKQSLSDRMDLLVDATLTTWGVFGTTVVTAADPATGASAVIDQHYRDAWRFAAGANYVLTDRWTIRGGLAYDQTPIPAAFVQAALPDRDRVYLSLGASYCFTNGWCLDVGYSHVHYVGDIPIHRTTTNGDTLSGQFDVGGNIVAAQLKFQY